MTPEDLLKRRIRQHREPCPVKKCGKKNRVIDATMMRDRFGLNLFFNCFFHGDYSKIRTIKGLLKKQ